MLLRFRPSTRDVRLDLPDGSTRLVKVTTNEIGTVQQVEDGNALHGTGRVVPVEIKIRGLGTPRARQAFAHDHETGLWAPVPGTLQKGDTS